MRPRVIGVIRLANTASDNAGFGTVRLRVHHDGRTGAGLSVTRSVLQVTQATRSHT